MNPDQLSLSHRTETADWRPDTHRDGFVKSSPTRSDQRRRSRTYSRHRPAASRSVPDDNLDVRTSNGLVQDLDASPPGGLSIGSPSRLWDGQVARRIDK